MLRVIAHASPERDLVRPNGPWHRVSGRYATETLEAGVSVSVGVEPASATLNGGTFGSLHGDLNLLQSDVLRDTPLPGTITARNRTD